jgi:hypothetical protein
LGEKENAQGKDFSFIGLERASWAEDWPASMFVAGAVLGTAHVPRPVWISSVLRSIKPLFLDTAGVGMVKKRLLIFGRLVAPLLSDRLSAALQERFPAAF